MEAVLASVARDAPPMPLNTSSGLSALETFDAVDYHLLRREWGPLSLFNGFPSAVHFALLALDLTSFFLSSLSSLATLSRLRRPATRGRSRRHGACAWAEA